MTTRLDHLLEDISPERTLDVLSARADAALNSFHMTQGRITHWDDFTDCLGRFLQHLDAVLLHLRKPLDVPVAYYWQRCVPLLLDLFGRNGEKSAFEAARTGTDGGLYAVLKAVANKVADQYATNEISARVLNYWNGLGVDEQLAATTEYLSKYGRYLPSELTEGSAARIRANFHRVLEEHPRIIRRLRRVGR
jgi:hypothetical protein